MFTVRSLRDVLSRAVNLDAQVVVQVGTQFYPIIDLTLKTAEGPPYKETAYAIRCSPQVMSKP